MKSTAAVVIVREAASLALVVQQTQQAAGLALDELQAARVVGEADVGPADALAPVLLLLVLEHVLVEVVLQVLVGVVDAQLLEAVARTEVLEAEYVEDAWGGLRYCLL